MALSFANATGNLFNRLGKLGLVIQQVRSYQNSQNTNLTNSSTGVVSQFNGEPDLQAIIGSNYINSLNGAGTIGTTMSFLAASTINRMVFRDNPRTGQTLTSFNTPASLAEVIRQMKLVGASVLAPTITAVPTSFTGSGNGIIVSSINRPVDGLVLENSFAETMLLVCTRDSFVGGATAGNESLAVVGAGNQANVFAFDWPLGSGSGASLNAIDGDVSNSSGNLLTNSSFQSWSGNKPANFTLVVGTAGTHIVQETSIVYGANNALRIAGDGSNLTQLTQQFNSSFGTGSTLEARNQYAFNVFARRDGVGAGAGVLTIDLVDGNDVVINDANNVANSFTIDLTALSTVYTSNSGIFRTPTILPAVQKLRLRLTTALTDGRSVYLDKMSFGAMTQVYRHGPFLTVHSGSVPFVGGDYATVAVTNSRGAGGTLNTFQTLFYRLFSEVRTNELLLPSSSSPTISDGDLIA